MSSPILNSLSKMSFAKVILISLLIGGVYYLNFYNDGQLLMNQISQVQMEAQAEEEKKKETDRIKAEEAAIKSQVGALSEKFLEITKKFPVNLKSDEIITTINNLAKATNVRVVSIFKDNVQTKELYEEVPLKAEFAGTFNNLLVMMYNISTLEKVTNLGDFEFLNSKNEYDGSLKMMTKVIGYKYRKPESTATSINSVNSQSNPQPSTTLTHTGGGT